MFGEFVESCDFRFDETDRVLVLSDIATSISETSNPAREFALVVDVPVDALVDRCQCLAEVLHRRLPRVEITD